MQGLIYEAYHTCKVYAWQYHNAPYLLMSRCVIIKEYALPFYAYHVLCNARMLNWLLVFARCFEPKSDLRVHCPFVLRMLLPRGEYVDPKLFMGSYIFLYMRI